uniref:Arf-GAP domain-containing protein n=1 Tax=Oryza rufipogon TaxID=4529 RepID=A0A0E0PQD0_ORYRU
MGSRVKEEERNERAIRALLKLPGNRRCINCNSLGPQYVCTSFSTFVCVSCSGIHREFTHRVKSISMAKFTSQEVSALQEGGNERGKEIYLKHWDFQGQPLPDIRSATKPDDYHRLLIDVDRLRNFIKIVYVDRRFTAERIGNHQPQAKGSRDDTYRNNNIDSSRGVQRGPYGGTSEDNHGPQHSTASTSEDQNNLNKHPVPAKVDQKNRTTTERENANTGKHQYLDGLQKTGGSSENNLKDTTKSVSSVVEPSKETNRKVLPIRLPDPPRSHKATTSTTPAEIQKVVPPRAADPSSKTTTDVKLEISKSLIDFDSDFEPHQGFGQTEVQKSSPLPDVGWATFDDTTPKNATATSISSTNSLNGPLVQILNSVSAPQISFPTRQSTKSLSFSQANNGSQQNQFFFRPTDNIQSYSSPLNRANSAPVNSQLWGAASQASIQGSHALPSNHGSNILAGTLASQRPAVDTTSSRGKALPEDIFTMSYHPYAANWDWRANPQLNMGYGQYNMQYPVGAANFPSLSSMRGALPHTGSTSMLPRAPFTGFVNSDLITPQILPPMTTNNHQFIVQQHDVKVTHQMQNASFPINQSHLPQVGGNPFF